jgi:hypothetical protein
MTHVSGGVHAALTCRMTRRPRRSSSARTAWRQNSPIRPSTQRATVPAATDLSYTTSRYVRRFEATALAFIVLNVALAVLVFREQRTLLFACDDAPGPPGDCLEGYNFLWLSFLVGIWILGALVLGVLAAVFYRRGFRDVSRHSRPSAN